MTTHLSISERLKADTMDLHMEAERHPLQGAMIRGLIGRETYAAYLGQLFLVQTAMERRLRALGEREARVARIAREDLCIAGLQRSDLVFFGVEPEGVEPLAETASAIARQDEEADREPIRALGRHYVLEGSKNGSVFIAKAIRKGLGLAGEEGVRSLEAHGARQREVWARWKSDADGLELSEAERDAVVESARAMFADVIGISQGVWSARPEAPEPAPIVVRRPDAARA